MTTFFVNSSPQYSRVPEIHKYGCRYLQQFETEKKVGDFKTMNDAISVAKAEFLVVEKCDVCSLGFGRKD